SVVRAHEGVRPVAPQGHAPGVPGVHGCKGDRSFAAAWDAPQATSVRLQGRARHRSPAFPQDAGDDQQQTGGRLLEGSGREEAVRRAANTTGARTPNHFAPGGRGWRSWNETNPRNTLYCTQDYAARGIARPAARVSTSAVRGTRRGEARLSASSGPVAT